MWNAILTSKGAGLFGVTLAMTMSVSREELQRLPLAERLDLVEELWDSIARESEQLTLTQAQIEELDRRLADYEQDPEQGVPWEEVRDRIRR